MVPTGERNHGRRRKAPYDNEAFVIVGNNAGNTNEWCSIKGSAIYSRYLGDGSSPSATPCLYEQKLKQLKQLKKKGKELWEELIMMK